jgi:hypothetical protein
MRVIHVQVEFIIHYIIFLAFTSSSYHLGHTFRPLSQKTNQRNARKSCLSNSPSKS